MITSIKLQNYLNYELTIIDEQLIIHKNKSFKDLPLNKILNLKEIEGNYLYKKIQTTIFRLFRN